MIPESLDKRNDVLFEKLVPISGKCATLEGETLRAINRIIYRYFNDGDYWFDGYGIETAGPAETFLRQFAPIDLRVELENSNCTEDEEYERHLIIILNKIITYIESRTEYVPNHRDMLECVTPVCTRMYNLIVPV